LNSAHGWLERPLKYLFDATGAKAMIPVFRVRQTCSALIIFKWNYPDKKGDAKMHRLFLLIFYYRESPLVALFFLEGLLK
jgi:hypothetical protein